MIMRISTEGSRSERECFHVSWMRYHSIENLKITNLRGNLDEDWNEGYFNGIFMNLND